MCSIPGPQCEPYRRGISKGCQRTGQRGHKCCTQSGHMIPVLLLSSTIRDSTYYRERTTRQEDFLQFLHMWPSRGEGHMCRNCKRESCRGRASACWPECAFLASCFYTASSRRVRPANWLL